VIVIEALTLVAVGVPVIVPVMPALLDVTAVAADRLDPVKVTGTVVPTAAAAGVTALTVGDAARTVKVTE